MWETIPGINGDEVNMRFTYYVGTMLVMFNLGCGHAPSRPTAAIPSKDGGTYLLAAIPANPQGVVAARSSLQDNDEAVVEGRIGGAVNPWVEGQAAFSLVDTALKPCDEIEDDNCATPWDYCCDTDELPRSMAMVKIVNGEGTTVAVDARQLLGVRELQTLIVHGRARRDEVGNLTILADGIYLKP